MTDEAEAEDNWIGRRWGKTEWKREGFHLLAWHCLDVAAVLDVILDRNPRLLDDLARDLGMEGEQTRRMLVTFAALHDIGKAADGFQWLACEVAKHIRLYDRGAERGEYKRRRNHHAHRFGHVLLLHLLDRKLVRTPLDPSMDRLDRAAFIAAFTGHHGIQPRVGLRIAEVGYDGHGHAIFDEAHDIEWAATFGNAVVRLFEWAEGSPGEGVARASYTLSGLVALADWLGSHTEFGFISEVMPLRTYYDTRALLKAREIVTAIAPAVAVSREPPPPLAFGALFRGEGDAPMTPRPMQAAVEHMLATVPSGPLILVIEDLTGSGKTEAGDLAVQRLIATGKATGAYFALPTTVTADKAYERKKAIIGRLFPGRPPDYVLAHGRSEDNKTFQRYDSRADTEKSEPGEPAEPGALTWFTEKSRQALLTEIGVGTIDQALLGALPNVHGAVRLLGLWRKVLVVDEVHAFDDYMLRLLEALLFFHAREGGGAILMSATLPSAIKRKLLAAYAEGAGFPPPAPGGKGPEAYPLLTLLSAEGMRAAPVPGAEREARRALAFEAVHDLDAVREKLLAFAKAGRSAIWFRNTIFDAIEGYDMMAEAFGEAGLPPPILYHARFLAKDREAIEAKVMEVADKDAKPGARRSRLVIATQVAEQSLDLDFDEAVIDLAPGDVMLQRLGRRRRHLRDVGGRLKEDGEDGRPDSPVIVHAPAREAAPDWYASKFPRATYVYPDDANLWLTLHHLLDPATLPARPADGPFRPAGDARALVESAYAEANAGLGEGGARPALELAQPLVERARAHRGAGNAKGQAAGKSVLSFKKGLQQDWGELDPDQSDSPHLPSRLADKGGPVLLCEERDGRLEPLDYDEERDSITRSTCGSPQALAGDEGAEARLRAALDLRPSRFLPPVLALQRRGAGWAGRALGRKDGTPFRVAYDAERGLSVEREG